MTLTITADTEGQLPNAKATLYTCPGATTAFVKSFTFTNTDPGTVNINFYWKRGTSRRKIPKDLMLETGDTLMSEDGDEFFLEAGDLLEGDATTAAVVDYVISIMERN